MNYKEFQELIKNIVQSQYDNGTVVVLQQIVKNNDIRLCGLSIQEPDCSISPTIYLDQYYDAYCKGQDLAKVVDSILDIHRTRKRQTMVDLSALDTFEEASAHMAFRLVSREWNEAYLQELVHWPFLDLELVCAFELSLGNSKGSFVLKKQQVESWNMSELSFWQQVFGKVKEPKMVLMPILDLLSEYMGIPHSMEVQQEEAGIQMYVLTNEERNYGAVCMTYPAILALAREQIGEDFYVLPSSVHECILLPVSQVNSWKDLAGMVSEINREHVDREEKLSDSIYIYNRQSGKLSLVQN